MTERERVARLLHRIECEEAGATEQEIRTWWERCDQDLYLSRADRVLDIAGARDVFPDTVTTLNVAHCSRWFCWRAPYVITPELELSHYFLTGPNVDDDPEGVPCELTLEGIAREVRYYMEPPADDDLFKDEWQGPYTWDQYRAVPVYVGQAIPVPPVEEPE